MKKLSLKTFFVFLLVPAFLLSFISKPDPANFSGEWKLNESKSDLGQFASFATRTIKATQQGDSIIIARTAPSYTGEDFTSTETLTFDGKESQTALMGESKKIASAKWSDDSQTLTITYKLLLDFNGQQTEVNGVETWSLSDGGKTLTLQNKSSSSFGDLATKGVYEKQ